MMMIVTGKMRTDDFYQDFDGDKQYHVDDHNVDE